MVELNHWNHSCEVMVPKLMPPAFAQTLWGHNFNLVDFFSRIVISCGILLCCFSCSMDVIITS